MAAGRKLVGSAQRTERRTVLQHGSILLEGSQARVSRLRARPDAQPDADGSVGIAELLGRVPEPAELAASIDAGLQTSLGIAFADTGLSAGELTLAGRLEVLYRDDAWTWRR